MEAVGMVKDTLRVSLDKIHEGVTRLPFEVSLPSLELTDWVRSGGPLRVDTEFSRVGDEISIRGRVTGTVAVSCDRCTRDFTRALDAPFLLYADRRGRLGPDAEEELELEKQIVFHDGRTLAFGEEVREEIILSFPIQSLCAEDCRGLCPRCGGDRNRDECRCPATDGSTPPAGPGSTPGPPG
jgi:uncharacterized protein